MSTQPNAPTLPLSDMEQHLIRELRQLPEHDQRFVASTATFLLDSHNGKWDKLEETDTTDLKALELAEETADLAPHEIQYALAKQLSAAQTIQTDYGDIELDDELRTALEAALSPLLAARLKGAQS